MVDQRPNDEANNRLRLLIAALPRDRLRGFNCQHIVSLQTLQLLLQCHRTLEILLTSCATDRLASEDNAWMAPPFSSITDLVTTIYGETDESSLVLQFPLATEVYAQVEHSLHRPSRFCLSVGST
jgi:hypothetical protein